MNLVRLFRFQKLTAGIPRRGIEELWKGGYLDPETPFREKERLSNTGYPWPSYLLRQKSFEDLRSLYFSCLKEKNLLLGERWAAYQNHMKPPKHGRLKKVKLTMKRILGVITRREIHQQCLRAKEILKAQVGGVSETFQEEKEVLETRLFKLKELLNELKFKIKRLNRTPNGLRLKSQDSLAKTGWVTAAAKIEAEMEEIEMKLQPLRKETLQLRTPNWRYERKYSDLPGRITWNKDYIPALKNALRRPFKFY